MELRVDFLVEEPSMEVFLRAWLPREVLPDSAFDVFPFRSKSDLIKSVPNRLKGYAKWIHEHHKILVLVDRDEDDCMSLKKDLEQAAKDAGVVSLSTGAEAWSVANRIVIEELEAWFFGDWEAVREAYPRVPPSLRKKQGYRIVDEIRGGTWEALERILQRAGYFGGGLRKLELSQAVGERFSAERCDSKSFQVFHALLRDLATELK